MEQRNWKLELALEKGTFYSDTTCKIKRCWQKNTHSLLISRARFLLQKSEILKKIYTEPFESVEIKEIFVFFSFHEAKLLFNCIMLMECCQ